MDSPAPSWKLCDSGDSPGSSIVYVPELSMAPPSLLIVNLACGAGKAGLQPTSRPRKGSKTVAVVGVGVTVVVLVWVGVIVDVDVKVSVTVGEGVLLWVGVPVSTKKGEKPLGVVVSV